MKVAANGKKGFLFFVELGWLKLDNEVHIF